LHLKITSSVQTCLNFLSNVIVGVFRGSGIGLVKFAQNKEKKERKRKTKRERTKEKRKKKKRERKEIP